MYISNTEEHTPELYHILKMSGIYAHSTFQHHSKPPSATFFQPAANLLLSRSVSPNLQSMKGAGTPKANAINPRRLFPHPKSSALYIAGAKRGNPNPASDRSTVAAAIALAAYLVYESTRYVWMHWKPIMTPAQKITAPILGIIQCT
jgi:hypothetical protein